MKYVATRILGSLKTLINILTRYKERRQPELIALTSMLSDRRYLARKGGAFHAGKTSKKEVISLLESLQDRVTQCDEDQPSTSSSQVSSGKGAHEVSGTVKEKLWGKLKNIYKSPPPKNLSLKEQFKRYLSGEELSTELQQLKALLESISPASVESERAFSAAGLFLTRIRSRLSDSSMNMLCVLRHSFLKES